MGADVPLKDLIHISKIKSPDYLYTHVTCDFRLEKYFSGLHTALPELPLVASGNAFIKSKSRSLKSVHVKKSLSEVMEFVNSL